MSVGGPGEARAGRGVSPGQEGAEPAMQGNVREAAMRGVAGAGGRGSGGSVP